MGNYKLIVKRVDGINKQSSFHTLRILFVVTLLAYHKKEKSNKCAILKQYLKPTLVITLQDVSLNFLKWNFNATFIFHDLTFHVKYFSLTFNIKPPIYGRKNKLLKNRVADFSRLLTILQVNSSEMVYSSKKCFSLKLKLLCLRVFIFVFCFKYRQHNHAHYSQPVPATFLYKNRCTVARNKDTVYDVNLLRFKPAMYISYYLKS